MDETVGELYPDVLLHSVQFRSVQMMDAMLICISIVVPKEHCLLQKFWQYGSGSAITVQISVEQNTQ